MSHKGLFITVEGIEGAGKTTALEFMQQYLVQKGRDVVMTREPGGTQVAEAIRNLLLHEFYEEKMCKETELLLFFASRAQHINQVIKPALKLNKIILCDRFTDASYAYQCGGRGIPEERIAILEKWTQKDLRPDIVILLDLPVEMGLERIHQRGDEHDRIEQEKIHFFEKVRNAYLERAKKFPDCYHVIDSSITIDSMKQQLQKLMDDILHA